MALASERDGKKWVQTATAIVCLIESYILWRFFVQLGDWFELEVMLPSYGVIAQVLAALVGLATFAIILKHPKTSSFLEETYKEMSKVAWPDKSETVRHTIGIIIMVTIAGFILWGFDISANFFLGLIN